MKAKHQRLLGVGLVAVGLMVAGLLSLRMFEENMMFFVDVTDVRAGDYPTDRTFRVGGLVEDGSMQREEGSLDVSFVITDLSCTLPVSYTGVLPDMVAEGKGVVAHGRMEGDTFVADKVLAKHDENYISPEVAESMAEHVEAQTATLSEQGPECPH